MSLGCSVRNGVCTLALTTASRTIQKRRQKDSKSQRSEKTIMQLSSGHDRTVHMNVQQLQFPVQYDTPQPVTEEKGAHETPTLVAIDR